MNDFRIVFVFKNKNYTRIVKANDVEDAKTKFLSKIKEDDRRELFITDVRSVETVTRNFSFDTENVANFLQWYLEQMDADEYDFNCTMEGKKVDENAKSELQAMQDFIKKNYLSRIQISVTGDRK